jgi:hypothetical protein
MTSCLYTIATKVTAIATLIFFVFHSSLMTNDNARPIYLGEPAAAITKPSYTKSLLGAIE